MLHFSTQSRAFRYATIATLLFSFNALAKWEKDKEYSLTILHTNDHHGRFWQNQKGEYGLSAQHTLVKQIRQDVASKNGSLLLLSGGDINTGVPESDIQNAKPDFLGMKMIGYDAMAVGNHEFDNPLQVLSMQEKWAEFPFLSANIYDNNTKRRLFKPYMLFNKQGLKIAVIGLTTEDTAKIANVEYVEDIVFTDPKAEARQVIDDLKATEKPDIIIAVTHMGHYDNGNHGSNAPGDVELARYLKPNSLDLIVGGHSQNPVCMEKENQRQQNYVPGTPCHPDRQNGTWIVQAHEWGKYVGRADFTFKNGKLTLKDYALLPVNLIKSTTQPDGTITNQLYATLIEQDAEMLDLLRPYQKEGQERLSVKIGESQIFLNGDRNVVRQEQTNLGQLIALSQMKHVNADFGIMNSGGVRDSIPAGDITYRDVLLVQPFGNIIAYAEMTGEELIPYLNEVAHKTPGSGGYPQFANITFKLEKGTLRDIKIGGNPLDLKKTYRFSLPSFCAQGGDGYPKIAHINTGNIDATALKLFIEKHSPITDAIFNAH